MSIYVAFTTGAVSTGGKPQSIAPTDKDSQGGGCPPQSVTGDLNTWKHKSKGVSGILTVALWNLCFFSLLSAVSSFPLSLWSLVSSVSQPQLARCVISTTFYHFSARNVGFGTERNIFFAILCGIERSFLRMQVRIDREARIVIHHALISCPAPLYRKNAPNAGLPIDVMTDADEGGKRERLALRCFFALFNLG